MQVFVVLSAISAFAVVGCSSSPTPAAGPAGATCSITDGTDGTKTLRCTDGTSAVLGPSGSGGSGAAGLSTVIRFDDEATGVNCPNGGIAAHAGADKNRNEKLDDDEITTTKYLCSPTVGARGVLEGDYFIDNSLDVAFLAGVTEITGALQLRPNRLTAVTVPSLVKVGAFDIRLHGDLGNLGGGDGPPTIKLSFPSLTTVARSMSVGGPDDISASFPKLATVGAELELGGGLFAFPSLASVGRLFVADSVARPAAGLATAFPKLVSSGDVRLWLLGATTVHFPVLTTAARLEFDPANSVTTASLPKLTTLSQDLVIDAPSLSTLEVPELASVRRIEVQNVGAASLTFPKLTTCGGLQFACASCLNLASLSFPELATVTGDVEYRRPINQPLALTLPKLTSISGSATVSAPHSAETFPMLASVGGTLTTRGTAAAPADFRALTTVGANLILDKMPANASVIAFPELTTVGASLVVTQNVHLDELATVFPKVKSVGDLHIESNANLVSVGLESLDTVATSFVVRSNAVLRACLVDALQAQLLAPPASVSKSGNSGAPNVCP